jgi:hypothetical protein
MVIAACSLVEGDLKARAVLQTPPLWAFTVRAHGIGILCLLEVECADAEQGDAAQIADWGILILLLLLRQGRSSLFNARSACRTESLCDYKLGATSRSMFALNVNLNRSLRIPTPPAEDESWIIGQRA